MNEARAPDVKEKAKQEYLKGMKYKDLAKKYNVSLNTIKSWIKRYNWSEEKKEKSASYNNKNVETHVFFSKYLPEETLNIIEEISKKSSLDILWESINIQYAAIIRAQRIMNVKDQKDLTKLLKKQKEYEFQLACDKQSVFLQAQSRAMKTLESMIKKYEELLKNNLSIEEQKLRIEKLKVDISNINGGNNDSSKEEIKEFIKATTMSEDEVKDLFKDDENEEEK